MPKRASPATRTTSVASGRCWRWTGGGVGLGFEGCVAGAEGGGPPPNQGVNCDAVDVGVELGVGVAAGCAFFAGVLAEADELLDAELPVVSGGLTVISLFGSACAQVVFPASSIVGFDWDCDVPELA